jgi:succinoglycan biosynthesis transport protein ExoP
MSDHAARGSAFDLALEVWSRRKWLAIGIFILVFAGVVGTVTFLPDIYRSTATVLVERHQVPEAFIRSSVTGELETRLQTISQEILSRARLEGLITRFGLYADLRKHAPVEAVVEKMRRDVQLELKGVEQMSGRSATVAFNLSYRGRDPRTVAEVTNTLASFYVEENSKIRERQASQTTQFLKNQLDETKRRLDEHEARLRDFRARHIGELPQQMGVNLSTLERLHAQLHLNSANQLRAADQRAAVMKQAAESDTAGVVGAAESTPARLAKLKRELVDLRSRFTDKYPEVIRLKAEILALEGELAEASSDARPTADAAATPEDRSVPSWKTALSQIDTEIKSLKAEEQRLRRDIDNYQRRVENAPQREQEFQELSRDFDMTKELYSSLLKRYEDAQLAENMEQSRQGEQFRILDPAIAATQPVAPNRTGLILIGVLVSLGAAGAAAVLAEQLDTSFHTFDDLRSFTKVPVLVSIPRIVCAAETARRARRRWLATASLTLGLALVAGVVLHGARQRPARAYPVARRVLTPDCAIVTSTSCVATHSSCSRPPGPAGCTGW